jgi:hypothetical protein
MTRWYKNWVQFIERQNELSPLAMILFDHPPIWTRGDASEGSYIGIFAMTAEMRSESSSKEL